MVEFMAQDSDLRKSCFETLTTELAKKKPVLNPRTFIFRLKEKGLKIQFYERPTE